MKLHQATYIVNDIHDLNRITQSKDKREIALGLLYEKHKDLFTNKTHFKSYVYRVKTVKKEKFTLTDLFFNFDKTNCKRYLKDNACKKYENND